MKTLGLAVSLCIVLAGRVACAAPLSDVNQYADRCAAELGAGSGAYMPVGLLPTPGNFSDTQEVPVFWSQKRITFEETNAATGAPQPGSGHWEFLFDGNPGAVGFPDGANTVGRITESQRASLKCDYWSHVNTTNRACVGGANDGKTCTGAAGCPGGTCTADVPTGCLPGQRILRRDAGTCSNSRQPCNAATPCPAGGTCSDIVTWAAVFRRLAPSRAGQIAFNPFHPFFFNNMDVIAFKVDTGGACWFDTLQSATLQVDNWWQGPAGTPAGIPRPGGKDTAKKTRAQNLWDTPTLVQNLAKPGERCTACHGTGPILVSRWINQGGHFTSQRQAREIPYWHPAKLFRDPFFKQFGAGTPATDCTGSCHNYWSVSASTMPEGELAESMTELPLLALASYYRRQIDAAGTPLARSCRGGTRVGQACAVDGDCPGGTCRAGQRAGILREMPHPYGGTPAQWLTAVEPGYVAMAACRRSCVGGTAGVPCDRDADCGAGGTCRVIDPLACSGTAQATIPAFFGAQSAPPAGKRQLIQPPYVAENVSFVRNSCVVGGDGSESCLYQVFWQDPTAGESDYHAADKYYLVVNAVANQPGQTPAASRFCATTNVEVIPNSKTLLPGSNWAMSYVVNGSLTSCKKTELRLCGGYAIDSAPGANDAHSPVDSRNDGDAERATLVTACAHQIKIERSGFRFHRATNRYVQTITLKNESAQAVAGPITYLLFNLSPNATLFGGNTTVAIVPAGTPYVNTAHSGLAAGATLFLQLEFTNPTHKGITYDARIRTGAGEL